MNTEEKRYNINELADLLDIHPQTLRKYEVDFKLHIPRDNNNSRYYTNNEKEVFETIVRLKNEGLTTKAINIMLNKSVTAIEQKERVLDIITVDRMTGEDVSLIFKKQINESINEFESRIKFEFDNLKSIYDEKLDQQKREFEFMLDRLRNHISKDIQNTFEQQSKKGFFSRMFNR